MARRTNDDFNNLNKDDREAGTGLIVSYQSEEGGITLAVPGDDDAPYVIANGRASDDGTTGLVEEPNGEMQRIAVDQWGHLWTVAYPAPAASIAKVLAALDGTGVAPPIVGPGTLQRVTLAIYSGAGFMLIFEGGTGGTLLYTPVPIPTTLPAYIDIEFDTISGLAFTTDVTVAISTTAPAYTAPAPGAATGTVTTSYSA